MTSKTWMRTRSGKRMELTAPSRNAIALKDIAYSLARLHRFTGHIETTVAQHSVSVMMALYHSPGFMDMAGAHTNMGPRSMLLAALLHDAHEAYTGDISLPMREAIGKVVGMRQGVQQNPVTVIKRGIQAEIHKAFGLPVVIPGALRNAIEVADRKALDMEVWWETEIGVPAWGKVQAEEHFYALTLRMWQDPTAADFIGRYSYNESGYGEEVS